MKLDRLQHILKQVASKKILVIGDLMLDEFVYGNVARISPEAPVPVVEVERTLSYPGGAANVARNLRQFCKEVIVLGQIGADQTGKKLTRLMKEERLHTENLLVFEEVPTTVKTRIIAQHQQVVRVDHEKRCYFTPALLSQAIAQGTAIVDQVDGILFEDYGKGFLCQELVTAIVECGGGNKIITSDPHPQNPLKWSSINVIKPNRIEAFAAAGIAWTPPVFPIEEDKMLLNVGKILLERWQSKALLITLGEQGMMLFQQEKLPYHTPTRAREIYDVSGAGDTAIALYTLGLVAGASPEESAELANHAAGIVVGKLGTATCSPEELIGSFSELAG